MERPKFTRAHYVKVAMALGNVSDHDARFEAAQKLADMFGEDNPSFKRDMFMKACGHPDIHAEKQ